MFAVRVGVVFKPFDCGLDAILVALEVNEAVLLLVTAANVPGGDAPVIVAATRAGFLPHKGLVGITLVQIRVNDLDNKPSAW